MTEDLVKTDEAIKNIEVIDAKEVKSGSICEPGKACSVSDFFEMITECSICGKLF